MPICHLAVVSIFQTITNGFRVNLHVLYVKRIAKSRIKVCDILRFRKTLTEYSLSTWSRCLSGNGPATTSRFQ